MSVFLPMFPLKLVAFPGERLNLHIFEPRYKQLVHECDARKITFGLPAFIDEKIQKIGTELELVSIEKTYSNGEMDITTKGVGVFRVKEFFANIEERLYAAAEVERINFDVEGDWLKYEKIIEHITTLYEVMNIQKPIPQHTPDFNTYQIAHHVGLSIEQEYQMLTIPEEIRRQDFMLDHLERLLPMAKEMEELRKKVQMNGHFKNILPLEF